MIGAFWILVFTVVVGVVIYLFELRYRRNHLSDESDESDESDLSDESDRSEKSEKSEKSECCGLHLVCEKDSLSPMSADIIYYDDEELDRFVGRDPKSYSAEEVEEFRDVLMTLLPEDVTGWARSITQRHIELPDDVRAELLMLVNEQRGR